MPGGAKAGVLSPSFLGLLVTQFLGAMNDSIFRWLAVFIGKDLVLEYYQGTGVAPEQLIESRQQMAVSAGLILLVLPYILLAAPAGYLGDRFSKQKVIVGCKVAEVVIMILGVAAILYGNIFVLYSVIFLMGAQSALFSPSKYGAIPELVRSERLQAANALVGMTTILAIVVGTVVPGQLYEWTRPLGRHDWWISAAVVVGVASVGLLASLLIRPLPPADPQRRFPLDAPGRMIEDFRALAAWRPLLLAALGSAIFWSVGGMCQLNVDRLASFDLAITPRATSALLGMLALGVGLGNVAAGLWSRGRVELGMVPYGAAGIALGAAALFFVPPSGLVVVSANFDRHQSIERLATLCRSDAVALEPLGSDRYAVVLTRRPGADVTIHVVAEPQLQAEPARLRFTPADWNRPQVVALRTVAAKLRPAAQFARVEHHLESADPAIDGLDAKASWAFVLSAAFLFVVGFSAGMYDVPLVSFLQQRSPQHTRGAILAANNALTFSLVILGAGVFYLISGALGFGGRTIFLLIALVMLGVAVVAAVALAREALRLLLWPIVHAMYRIRVVGLENLPREGGALLVPNHVTWVDGFILAMSLPGYIRFLVYAEYFERWWSAWFGRVARVIKIVPGRRSAIESIREAREALAAGEVVCVFPEGTLTRSGRIEAFQPGFIKMVKGIDVPVVPVYLGGLWGSVFSFEGGRFFWKLPRRVCDPVTVRLGAPIHHPTSPEQVRRAVLELARAEGHVQDDAEERDDER